MTSVHPALRVSSLQALPLKLRLDAQAACRVNGSSTKATLVLRAFDPPHPTLTVTQQAGYFPLVYHLLDPKLVPVFAGDDFPDAIDNTTLTTISTATIAMNVFFRIAAPIFPVGPDLWPRLWPWFAFVYRWWGQLHGILGFPEKPVLFRNFVITLGRLSANAGGNPHKFLLQSPGLRSILVNIWKEHVPTEDVPQRLRMVLIDFTNFIMPLVPSQKANMEELVAGAGSMEDMASLIVIHLQRLLDDAKLSDLEDGAFVHLIRTIVGLILHGDFSTLKGVGKLFETDWFLLPLGDLIDALLDNTDFLPTLLRCISSLSSTAAADTGRTLEECWMVIERIILCRQGDVYPMHVIRAGVLVAVIHSARNNYPGKDLVTPSLRRVLVESLDLSCLYRYNASMLSTVLKLPEIQKDSRHPAFVKSETYPHWLALLHAVEERKRPLDLTYARLWGICARHKTCDNSACQRMTLRRELKKCACEGVLYCSKSCQKADWKRGHREVCSAYAFLTLSDRTDRFLVYFDRKYIRHLLDDEYYRNFDSILAKQVVFLASRYAKVRESGGDPDYTILPVTVFNHAFGPARIEVRSIEETAETVARCEKHLDAQREWRDVVRRAQASEGRMALHIVDALHFHGERIIVVPLWAASGLVWDTVKNVARQISAEWKENGWTRSAESEKRVVEDPRFNSVRLARLQVETECCGIEQVSMYRLDAAGH
ncbi:MYND-type domain-containing protein [Mycena indigotica]|uniref:MYND-type domain-containing protein n=1 Tax=Mycena indigotica TaxID=2126181 RepID=A0A8H6T4U3_9AGAR|nr:MYND-type domain-containing protein [Mycena indigotica]KAF7311758.1 MYND-type domain-containing protein [Mycena indigotica]